MKRVTKPGPRNFDELVCPDQKNPSILGVDVPVSGTFAFDKELTLASFCTT